MSVPRSRRRGVADDDGPELFTGHRDGVPLGGVVEHEVSDSLDVDRAVELLDRLDAVDDELTDRVAPGGEVLALHGCSFDVRSRRSPGAGLQGHRPRGTLSGYTMSCVRVTLQEVGGARRTIPA